MRTFLVDLGAVLETGPATRSRLLLKLCNVARATTEDHLTA